MPNRARTLKNELPRHPDPRFFSTLDAKMKRNVEIKGALASTKLGRLAKWMPEGMRFQCF
jgi:hypothetical protein